MVDTCGCVCSVAVSVNRYGPLRVAQQTQGSAAVNKLARKRGVVRREGKDWHLCEVDAQGVLE